jgi:hypothetical protein
MPALVKVKTSSIARQQVIVLYGKTWLKSGIWRIRVTTAENVW